MNLPNALTVSRLAAIPVLMALLILRFPFHDELAGAIFLLASLSDTLDGNLARRRHQVTELGKFLDPLADKLFILSVLIVLVQEGSLPAWVVVVIFGRELLITILRSVSASQGRVIAATPWGKTKTVSQVIAVLLLILQRPHPELGLAAWAGLAFAVLFTVLSGVDYVWRFRHVLQRLPLGPAAPNLPVATGGAPGAESPVDPLARLLAERLGAGGQTLAVAESCTGGLLGAVITDQPGSSRFFQGGVIAYSDTVKRRDLGVPARLLETHGAVSAEVAEAMAVGVRARFGTDLALAVTGIAGPGIDRSPKPVGLTFISLAAEGGAEVRRLQLAGDRWENRRAAVAEALGFLLARLEPPAEDPGP